MRIGVYGDSFACSSTKARHFAWYNLLANRLGGEVYNFDSNQYMDTYGIGGSSTFYSYQHFLKHHTKYDLNIFVASDATKYTKLVEIFEDRGPQPISGICSLEWYMDSPHLSDKGKEILEQLKNWFLVNDEKFMIAVQELILQDIERKSKNTIILATALEETFCEERRKKNDIIFGMWELVHVIHDSLGCRDNKMRGNEREDKIAAHMTKEGNEFFATLLYNYITKKEKMILPSYIKHDNHYTHYYIKD